MIGNPLPTRGTLSFRVHGRPAGQGSKKYLGNGRMVESSRHLQPWREAVKHAALAKMGDDWAPLEGPVWVEVWVSFHRPKSHFRTGRNAHLLRDDAPVWQTTTPDGDKIGRACLDALTAAGVWRDDRQASVVTVCKQYEDPEQPFEGAVIDVRGLR